MNDAPLPAGRELDALIIQKLQPKGAKTLRYAGDDPEHQFPEWIPSGKPWRTHSLDGEMVPFFSTRIADAWALVAFFDDYVLRQRKNEDFATCEAENGRLCTVQYGETMPLAICRAALALVEEARR